MEEARERPTDPAPAAPEVAPALVPSAVEAPKAPAPPTRREKLLAFGRLLRERFRTKKEQELAERAELAMADGKIVYAPTRAEIVIACLRSLVWAPPFLVLLGIWLVIVVSLLENLVGMRASALLAPPPYVPTRLVPLMMVGTSAFILLLIQLVPKARPRSLYVVRVRVMEKGNREAILLALAILFLYSPCIFLTIFG